MKTPTAKQDPITALHAQLDTALTKFAMEDDPEKKKKSLGKTLAGAAATLGAGAAVGAGAGVVNDAVMKNAQQAGPVQSVGAAYKTAAADAQRNVQNAVGGVVKQWNNPRGGNNRFVSPTAMNKVKSAGGEALKQGRQLVRKIVRTVTHYDDPTIKTLTQLNAQADQALTQFAERKHA